MMSIITRVARRCGINLNYLFDPRTAYRRREPLRLTRDGDMTRRAILTALPATGAALPLAGFAASATHGDTPIQRLFHEWAELRSWVNYQEDLTDEVLDASTDAMIVLEHKIEELPTTCAADYMAKILVGTHFFNLCPHREHALSQEALTTLGVPERLLNRVF